MTAGTAAATGTGAFTSVSANRTVDVDVADDNDALLALDDVDSSPNAQYVTADGSEGTLSISLDEHNGNVLGEGVNDNAVTRINNLFSVQNQGTQPVTVTASETGDYPEATTFAVNFSTSHPNLPFWGPNNATFHYLNPERRNATIGVGETVYVSLEVDTTAVDVSVGDTIISGLTISAEVPE